MQISVDIKNLEKVLNKLDFSHYLSVTERALDAVLNYGELVAKQNAPVRTGHLRSSITHKFIEPLKGKIGTAIQYAPYPEFGTGIYGPEGREIKPVRKKVLADKRSGIVYGKSVRGQVPKHYMQKTFDTLKSDAPKLFSKYVKQGIEGLVR